MLKLFSGKLFGKKFPRALSKSFGTGKNDMVKAQSESFCGGMVFRGTFWKKVSPSPFKKLRDGEKRYGKGIV